MRPLSLQSIRAIGRQPGLRLHPISRRTISISPICLEESKPDSGAESERQKGVPLATELDGISINKTAQGPTRRLSLLEKLAARRSQQAKTTRSALPDSKKPDVSSEKKGQRGEYRSRTSSDQQRRPFRNSNEAGAMRSRRNDGVSDDRQGKAVQVGRGGKPRSGGQRNSSSSQARQGDWKARADGRAQGQGDGRGQGQRQGQRGPAKASSPRKRTQGRPNERTRRDNGRNKRSTDPELNDYPNAEGRNPPPIRHYDAQGLLILKGDHAQLSPVIPPQLPKFEPLPTSPRKSGSTRVFQTMSYLDRAPPKCAADPLRNVLGVVDNAELALSRVRQMDVQQRRDALAIVQKMVGPAAGAAKAPITSA